METSQPTERPEPWWRRNWQMLLAVTIWVVLVGGFLAATIITGRSPNEALGDLIELLRSPLGPLIYIIIYALRPLAFFSAVIVSLLGGAIWGPLWGLLYVVIGSNLSATVAYGFGRALGGNLVADDDSGATKGLMQRYADRLRNEAFITILLMRLLYLPYDLVNYLAGFLRVKYVLFIAATIIGSLPGTLTFVLAGASINIDDILAGQFAVTAINPWTLALSVVLFVGGLAVSRWLRGREGSVDSVTEGTKNA